MFAFTAENGQLGRKEIKRTAVGQSVCFEIGRAVGRRKLLKALKPFGQDVIFALGTDKRGISAFPTSDISDGLLFNIFYDHAVKNCRNHVVGISDKDGRFITKPYMTDIISAAEVTVIYTTLSCDGLLETWFYETGTFPVTTEAECDLTKCDCVFAPTGLENFGGILFSHSYFGNLKEAVPREYRSLSALGADTAELLSMISREAR